MKPDLQLEQFSGPLHLLLELVQQEDLDITELSLAQVAEQFIQYLDQVQDQSPEELADFLVVATQLLLLKSRALLPHLEPELEEDPGQLAAQLRMYKTYADAAGGIQSLLSAGQMLFPRPWSRPEQVAQFSPPTDLATTTLRQLFLDVLLRLEPVVRIPKAAIERVVSLREKMLQIQDLFAKHARLRFVDLLQDTTDRGELVVTFLAILELIKQQTLTVHQTEAFAELILEKPAA